MVRELPLTLFRGFCMGAADIVPGVSGGTIALVFGIYERLVLAVKTGSTALGHFVTGDFAGGVEHLRRVEWTFILPLGGGIVTAVLLLAGVLEHQLEENPVELSGLFLGLVVGSVVVAALMVRRRDPTVVAVGAAVAVVVFFGLGLTEGTTEETVSQVSDPALWYFFGAGALAICAMILPGISGSFILVVLGMYEPVLDAVSDRDLPPVVLFAVGAVLGLALFSQLLEWALEHHHDLVLSALIGLMVGSLRVLWPWPDGIDSTELHAPADPVVVPVALAVLAGVIVVAVGLGARQLEERLTTDVP